MKAYMFDHDGVYTGECDCQLSPLESTPGAPVYLIPAQATSVVPMAEVAGSRRVFNGISWTLQPVPVVIAPAIL